MLDLFKTVCFQEKYEFLNWIKRKERKKNYQEPNDFSINLLYLKHHNERSRKNIVNTGKK